MPPSCRQLQQGAPQFAVGRALTLAALIIPLLIVITALVPALMICPFLSPRHQRLVLRLLAGLCQWVSVITNARAPRQLVSRLPSLVC